MANADNNIDLQLKGYISNEERKSFFLFAGAGSGKTYSLVKLLENIQVIWGNKLKQEHRQVAVITYTNAATDEIMRRIDYNPLFHVSTIHSFVWDSIKTYQKDIKARYLQRLQANIDELQAKIDATKNKETKTYKANQEKINYLIERKEAKEKIDKFIYNPNGDNLKANSLNHSDVIEIGTQMMQENLLLQQIITQQYPFMLIDESQDTRSGLVDAFFTIQKSFPNDFTLGLIGDIKQRIYMDGKADIKNLIPADWEKPEKVMNYRCSKRIIQLANKISSVLDGSEQQARDNAPEGYVHLFLVNSHDVLDKNAKELDMRAKMSVITGDEQWNSDVKVLTLEHRMAAVRLDFEDFYELFARLPKYQMSFLQGEMAEMSFFANMVFPLMTMLKEYDGIGVLNLLKKKSPLLEAVPDRNYPEVLGKIRKVLDNLRSSKLEEMKVSEIIEFIQKTSLFDIPDYLLLALKSKEEDIDKDDTEALVWVKALQLPLGQFKAYDDYVHDRTPYATHQGVKGLEFPRVLVLVDDKEAKGNLFSYDKLFKVAPLSNTDIQNKEKGKDNSLDRTGRLFYVTCTRAKESLAIVMYTSDPEKAKKTSIENEWFNEDEITII
ncbi:ATP-dependent helicase [Prevotella stercorea]|uniref:UvrD-helicase domain-containing protein n=1 Tax=Leyella stercorea TaxID=363265 RepID=UPI001F330AAF|nr:UvrD-helicase domain-containing protein [Leyella stercorea]MCF2646271.1 ATP-dependent helicase [Leyella stercorea]